MPSDQHNLDQKFLEEEVQLWNQFEAIKNDKRIPKVDQGKWARVFFYYELGREICIHWIGKEPMDLDLFLKLKPDSYGIESEPKAHLAIIHSELRKKDNEFQPWCLLKHDRKADLVSGYNSRVEAINTSRLLWLQDDYAPELAASLQRDEIIKRMRDFYDESMDQFDLHIPDEPHVVMEKIMNRLQQTGPEGWLIGRFNPKEINSWDRIFANWKAEQISYYKLKVPAVKKGIESIDDWLNQLSRVRVLRKFNWDPTKAEKAHRISHIKPSKMPLWMDSVRSINEHCLRYFSIDMSLYKTLKNKLNRSEI